MAIIPVDGNPNRDLIEADYGAEGQLKTEDADCALVCGAASRAESFLVSKQWNLLWRDADMLYQSPRPMSVYENTYVLEPNVQRFTVAKVVNAVVPSLYKGLFYADPPMILRPRPGTTQDVVEAKTALFSYMLESCKFKRETKWGLEQMGHLGTSIFKWGVRYQKVITLKRTAQKTTLSAGPGNIKDTDTIYLDVKPEITTTEKYVPRPFFEFRPIEHVLVDPKCPYGDIQAADFAIDVRHMDFYQLLEIKKGVDALDDSDPEKSEWRLPSIETIKSWWIPPTTSDSTTMLASEQASLAKGIVHHAEEQQIQVSPDILFAKKEILEYWDKTRKIMVISRRHTIRKGENEFGILPFLSANWWNRPKAFYGMGLGLIVGQNQRVDQGTINSILKILSFGVNPVYLRKRDSNSPTQMIRTGLGRIVTVDTEVDKAYHLMETPKVPSDTWAALRESEQATESSSGADQQLVQGSTAGPRSSMGRTATGAGYQANASATRLDGPLDNFIEQVFKPFLYILDMLITRYISDAEIYAILRDELGKAALIDLQDFHDARIEYEVLAGSSLAAKRTMAQSMMLITQIFNNPNLQENLADINEEYIDFKPILKMWMEASEWKNTYDIIKPLTEQMKAKRAAKSQAAMQQSKAAMQQQSSQQKLQNDQVLDSTRTDNRIKRDLTLESFRANTSSEGTEGVPSAAGLEGQMPTVV